VLSTSDQDVLQYNTIMSFYLENKRQNKSRRQLIRLPAHTQARMCTYAGTHKHTTIVMAISRVKPRKSFTAAIIITAILPTATHVTVAWSVHLHVLYHIVRMSSVTLMHPAKATGWNEMPIGRDTCVVSNNAVLDRSSHGNENWRSKSPVLSDAAY